VTITAEGPDRLWLTNITERATTEGKHSLRAIEDAWSNRIVGWSIDVRMKASLVVAATEMAIGCSRARTEWCS
jgi:transposase InsO family protein